MTFDFKAQNPYTFPIPLNSNLESISLPDGAQVRRLHDGELKEFFGIERNKDASIDFNGNEKILFHPLFLNNSSNIIRWLQSVNYAFIGHEYGQRQSSKFEDAIQIFTLNSTRICVGISNTRESSFGGAIGFGYEAFPLCEINNNNLQKFVDLYSGFEKLSDSKKLGQVVQRYKYAVSGGVIPLENRFIDLMIVLETLYLPSTDRGELSFRISLLIAKQLSEALNEQEEGVFSKIKTFYKIRSEIVHNGKSVKLSKENFSDLANLARESIALYIIQPEKFDDIFLRQLPFN